MIRGRVVTLPGGITVRWPDEHDEEPPVPRRPHRTRSEAARDAWSLLGIDERRRRGERASQAQQRFTAEMVTDLRRDGLSQREVARRLGCSLTTVQSRLRTLRKAARP